MGGTVGSTVAGAVTTGRGVVGVVVVDVVVVGVVVVGIAGSITKGKVPTVGGAPEPGRLGCESYVDFNHLQ